MKSILMRLFVGEIKTKSSGAASRNLPLLLLCGILWVVGCSSVGKFLPSKSSVSTNQTPDAPKATASPVERLLQLNQPRVMKYADLQFTVTKAVISRRIADELPIDNSKPDIADITFSVVNTLKDAVRIESGLWQLRLGDGSIYKQIYSDAFEPRDTKERKISFRVPANSQWNGAQLTLDEQDKEPATLVLDGPLPPSQYPINLATSGGETTNKGDNLAYSIAKATLDLDAFGKRAALGKRYLILTVRVKDKGAGGGGGYFLPEYFRLLIDGTPTAPESASDTSLNSGGSADYTMAYVIPANIGRVELEVGKPDASELANIPIDLKPVNP
ncbi:MAG: hypothetical protein M3033_06190 [Acidobacteriota bacterium]|nr:hypothetical protein [Acidobacteriota bacterium]